MKCSECIYYECVLRSPIGGCPNGEKEENQVQINTTNNTNTLYKIRNAIETADEYCVKSGSPFSNTEKAAVIYGYLKATKDIISLIESRIAEILGDAQPAPVLRIELQELINKIKEEK